jgi:phosphate uptake regulator
MNYNVTVGFQYQVTAENTRDAADIARGHLVDDIENVYQYEDGVKKLVEHSITTVHAGVDYDEIMRDIWANSDK